MQSVSVDETARIQRRVFRLILTNFVVWVPISVLSYVRLAGWPLSKVTYEVAAGVLLPINAVTNPWMYSRMSERMGAFARSLFSLSAWTKAGPKQGGSQPSSTGRSMTETRVPEDIPLSVGDEI